MFFVIKRCTTSSFFFFFNDTATTEIYTLSLHDALPISRFHKRKRTCWIPSKLGSPGSSVASGIQSFASRSEEHTSELQSPCNLVCRLLLEKKKNALAIPIRKYHTQISHCSYIFL